MNDLPLTLDDYRELAAFLERQIAEASVSAPGEVDELRARLARLHEILARTTDPGDLAGRQLQDQFEAEAFDLKMKRASLPDAAAHAAVAMKAVNGTAPHPAARRGSTARDLEALVLADPSDDELRRRYIELAEAEGGQLRAADVLVRAMGEGVRPDVRERVGFDVATLYVGEGELPKARAAFLEVLGAGANGPAALAAARRLLRLQVDSSDQDLVGPANETIAKADPDPAARQEAAENVLRLHSVAPQKDVRLAVAYRALVGTTRSTEALSWLRRFYAKSGNAGGFVEWLEHAEHWGPLAKVIESDIDLAPAKEKGRLFAQLGEIRLVRLGDANGAVAAFGRALALDPIGAADTALAAMTRAHASLRDRDRHDLVMKIAKALSRKELGSRALGLCRELFAEPSLEAATVQEIAEIAHDEDDNDLYRYALEHLTHVGDEESRKKALERLGDFQFAQLGDRKAAAASWRPAARMYESTPEERGHALSLYERVLEAVPDDGEAAGRLAEMYATSGDWSKLPEVLRVLMRSGKDAERSARILLSLEKSAVDAGEVGEYVALLDDLVAHTPTGSGPSEALSTVKRVRARALGADASRRADAAAAYRDLIESSKKDEDVAAFEAFLDAWPNAEERLHERRWLYERRVAHGPRQAEVLLEWARAEEELGETEAAITLYLRLAELAPSQREGLEALCRLKLHTGDFEGGLAALRSLREIGTEEERRGVTLRMARVLLEDLGRPAEAALALAPLLDVVPPMPAARQLMRRALADPAAREQVADSVEQLAKGDDRAAARRVFQFLIDARDETASLTGARRRWYERLIDLSGTDARAILSAAARGAAELPDALPLWDQVERAARELGQPDAVVKAYRDALVEKVDDAELAETLARRMLAFAGDFALPDSTRLVEALQKLLDLVPGARWALDRVKLVLGSAARWDELFRLYDRAIEATADDKERADLLDEAARAAKDVAGQPERAIPYLEAIHNIRPDDVAVRTALERTYERQGRTRDLLELLLDSVEASAGFQRREMLQRIASLWLDLGGVTEALVVVDRTLAEGAVTADVVPLLERIAAGPKTTEPVTSTDATDPAVAAQTLSKTLQRAAALLRQHYESLGQAEDVVRLAVRQVELTEGAGLRARAITDLKSLLSRTSKLSLERARRRQLLRQAACACAARAADREPAIGLFAELFEEDPGDEAAAESVEEYGALLEATAQPAKLAKLWEDQARVHAAANRPTQQAAQRLCWERAASVWRKQDKRAQAIAAYKEAAALESEPAFEGLAELHEQSGDWASAVPALEWLYLHSPPTSRGQRVLRLAKGCIALDDGARARARLEEALEAGVESERLDEVCDTLVGLYRRDGAWRPLAERLVANATRTKDTDRRVALLREAADLLRSKVDAPAEAATLLEKAVQLRASDPTIRPDLADVLEAAQRWDRVIDVLKEQVALFGSQRSRERALTHRRLALAMAHAGRGKDALADLRAAAEMLPAHPGVLHDLARTALELGQLELAESTFRALLLALHHPTEDGATAPPHRAEVFLDLAEIAVRRSDQPRAEDLVDSAVDAVLETGEEPERFDAILASRGRGDLLARAIERRVERSSSLAARASALGALADAWASKLGRPEELKGRIARHAARVGRELEHEGATDVAAWSALGSVHAALGDGAARAATDRRLTALLEGAIAKAAPGPARAKLRVGFARSLLGTAGGGEAAIAALSAALEDDPEDAAAAELLATALAAAGRSADARAAFERLLARRPDDPSALEKLASLAQAEGDWEAAAGAYRRLLSLSAGRERLAHVATELADACEKAGRPDDARDALEQALTEAPDSAPLMQRLALICERSGDWTRLARLAESLRTKNPESAEAVLLWAHALRMLSRSQEATAALTAAIERLRGKRTPLLARLLVEAARAHLAADELVEAFEHLKAAFAIDARSGEGALLFALVAIDLDDERTAERALFAITGTQAKTDAERRLQATAFYHLAAMAFTKGDGGKARRLATKALGIEPGLADAQALVEAIDAAGSAVVPRSGVASVRPPAPTAVTPRS